MSVEGGPTPVEAGVPSPEVREPLDEFYMCIEHNSVVFQTPDHLLICYEGGHVIQSPDEIQLAVGRVVNFDLNDYLEDYGETA